MPTLKVLNPFDQSVAFEVPFDTEETVAQKIARARAAFSVWRRTPLDERIARLREGLSYFSGYSAEIARDLTLQMGKPIRESRREIDTLFDRAGYMCSIASQALAPDVLPVKDGFHRRIEHEPHGVVLDVAAWNYPLIIPANVIIPALLAGNVVLLKHSARTPHCGTHFERAFSSLAPEGLVQNLVLSHEALGRVIEGRSVDYIAFTGSVEGGREVYQEAARRLLDVGLELGGKDPAYVAADADLDFTAANVVDGACYNAGQSCCAVERVYVHHTVYDEFLVKAKKVMEGYRLGNPLEEETTMGPLASREALDVLDAQVADALKGGARLLLGGRRLPSTSGNFFPPTLLADVGKERLVMREESFGPILPALAVGSDEEALNLMNDSLYGLTASVWTRDPERAERLAHDLRAGTVYRNRCDYLDPALPWTGWGESGIGSTLSRYGFYGLTRRKSLHFRTAP